MVRKLRMLLKDSFLALGLDIKRLDNKFLWLKRHNVQTIFDVGANTGQFARMIHKVLPEASIYSFEPLKDCYEGLLRNMRGIPDFRAFNLALGDEDGESEIHRNEFSPSSSILAMGDLHKQAFPYTQREKREPIQIRRLDGIAQELPCPTNILVKLDVQGYEDKVIQGSMELISKTRILIVEVSFRSLYQRQPLFDSIYTLLKLAGFSYAGNLDQVTDPRDGSILQADAIFIKD